MMKQTVSFFFLLLFFVDLQPILAWELSNGTSQKQDLYWNRTSLLKGRDRSAVVTESRKWIFLKFEFDKGTYSVKQEQVKTQHFNDAKTLLEQRIITQLTPKFTYKDKNLDFSVWRTLEQVGDNKGNYRDTQTSVNPTPLDFFHFKIEKNREFFEINRGVDYDNALIQDSGISQHYYQWNELAVGAYSRRLSGWRLGLKQRRQLYPKPDASTDVSGFGLTQLTYFDEKPSRPNLEAYWRFFRVHLETMAIDNKKGSQLRVESAFSWILLNAQHLFTYTFLGRTLKVSYDKTSPSVPYRVISTSSQIINQFSYKGESQLFSSPLLVNWGYSYHDVPFISDYRSDFFTLGLSLNF